MVDTFRHRLTTRARAVLLALAALAVAGSSTSAAVLAFGGPGGGHNGLPPIKHVWLIILENKSYEASFTGLNQNSYLWETLPSYGVLLSQYYGTGHYSADNYVSLVSGQAPTPDVQNDCPQYTDVSPGTPAADGQVNASSGCVYPGYVQTLFNQFDQNGISWKAYMQDMGNDPTREEANDCGIPGNPSGSGVVDPGSAEPASSNTATGIADQYVPKHNPTVSFDSLINTPNCQNVEALGPWNSGPTSAPGLAHDLQSEATTPEFSWITPNNCDDAHDATCKGPDDPTTQPANQPPGSQGGLYASDIFLKFWIPKIMASPAFQDDGLIDITFDEAFPPYTIYGNSFNNYGAAGEPGNANSALNVSTDTAQSVVACCNELPGPNTTEPGAQAFGQDTTPGGGITGSVLISRYIKPGTVSAQPYNHYSWLRSMEDLFGIDRGGTDGEGHLGYAAAPGLIPFGADVYSNPSGWGWSTPVPSGSGGTFLARAGGYPLDEDNR